MTTTITNIPVAILIFEKDGSYTYAAYSPKSESDITDPVISNQKFIENVYLDIGYNINTPLNNNTRHGLLLEVHTRYSNTPLHERGNTVYFGVYSHLHCKYSPVHTTLPITFHAPTIDSYESSLSSNTNVSMISTTHEFV
jgi:hypothetical protein